MAQRARETAFAALFFFVLIAAATYPLGNLASPALPQNDDALFNVWRLSWVAHQLRADPVHLLDGNIFHPAKGTLLHSDAMLAPGLAGAPFLWAGLHQVAVHNLLLLMALFLSALACYALCRDLAGDGVAAVFGGIVFALAPFRFGHIMHMELQWAVAMPLVLLVLHRASRRPVTSVWRTGASAGVLLALQGLSSLYYAAFFSIFLAAWSGLTLFDTAREQRRKFLLVLATACAVGGLLLAPYLAEYANARRTLGPRSISEIQEYSATLPDYFRVSDESKTYTPSDAPGAVERSLSPGLTAAVLAAAGLFVARGRTRWIYAALAMLSIDLSLGTNGLTYPIVLQLLPVFSSFRAPARYGILVLLALAVLSSIGLAAVRARLGPHARWLLTFAVVAACVGEYWVAPINTRRVPLQPPAVYRWLAEERGRVILELPVPPPSALWLYETTHEFWSTFHWNSLVNGYSGSATPAYVETLEIIQQGDPERIARRLQALGVDYLILHERLYGPVAFAEAFRFYITLPGAGATLSFDDPDDPAVVIPFSSQ